MRSAVVLFGKDRAVFPEKRDGNNVLHWNEEDSLSLGSFVMTRADWNSCHGSDESYSYMNSGLVEFRPSTAAAREAIS